MDDSDATAMAIVGRYVADFRARTTQLNGYAIGGRWWKLRVPAPIAAAWARLGYLPEDAAPLIAQGITPAMVREMEEHDEEQAGGREALAANRTAEILALNGIYGPDDLVTVEDLTGPDHLLVMLREDLDQNGDGHA